MLQDADPMKFSNYYLDGIRYFICDGEVYTNDETGARVKVDMLPSSIQMYGECVDDPLFELKITEIKEMSSNHALITGDDGSGLSFLNGYHKSAVLKTPIKKVNYDTIHKRIQRTGNFIV